MIATKIIPPAAGAYAYPLLIKQLLLSGVRYEPGREIVYADKLRYSYQTLNKRIRRLANALTAAGVKAGDTVALLDWDSHRYLECFFAVPMIGAVLHTVNIRLSAEQVLFTMNHAEDDLVLVHDDFLPLVEQLQGQLTTVKGYLQLTDETAADTCLPVVGEYEQLLAEAADQYAFPDFDENSVATLFYTTGTTGDPKGVYFTHRQLVLHTLNAVGTLGVYQGLPLLRSDDVYMPITPMFHVHAWGVPYVATLMGLKQVYPGRYEPNRLVQLYREEKVTFSHCVPTILQMILNCEAGKHSRFDGWKMLLGGSALTLGIASEASARGIQVHSGYGMSETCPVLCTTYLRTEDLQQPMQDQLATRIKTGVPVPMVDLKIIDAAGNDVPHDGEAQGEIVVRAPWLTQGYLKEPQKGAELWQGGWLHTGDMASIDAMGGVEIKDRIKDVIKTGGEWISSLELESLISEHTAVMSVAVVGIVDEQWGERPMALVVCEPGHYLDRKILEAHLQSFVDIGRINKWAIPKQFKFVSEIPKTSVGKINKKLIREQATS
ncbi:fatty acid--CoA ligase [Pseudomonas sp. P5_152]|jgi:fatty-acyl-CoA synthase|uniref:fatty acid--CoA ligase n=1 Tax=unclassified Pseudomonas TaxID=196821 RepID=UPI00131FE8B7|nr:MULTISPECIES: fatty acid--CoA ligase [unclassified Pseudomonas]MDX9663495.1 fatty acid--CoA ligase [Pseudomonas sp. P5_152]QHD01461.1 long-chain fatty acid--CoA ligase [Pseudomonas sp. S04]QHF33945.1 long-chain fatty acid--CoA ligase [Pseudomonas sp. S19]